MKRIAMLMLFTLTLAAFGKFSLDGRHPRQAVADQGDDGGSGSDDDDGDDS